MTRRTSARKFILAALQQADAHKSAYEIYDEVKPLLPSLNLSTVYRTMEYLVNEGLISVSDVGTGTPVYESVTHEHHHIVCQKCGQIILVENDDVRPFFEQMRIKTGFDIVTNHLILFGICSACQKKDN